jgi:phage shock protein PspC (stress-responsive transcriptional regulator)
MAETMTPPPDGPDGDDMPPPPPPPPGEPPWLPGALAGLRRSSSDRKIAGVAGGLGRRYDIEPWLVRVGFIVLTIFGVGIALYIVGWLLLPTDVEPSIAERRGWSRNTAIAVAIIAGVAVLAGTLGGPLRRNPGWAFPWLIIGFGLWLMLRSTDTRSAPVMARTAAPVVEPDTGFGPATTFGPRARPVDPTLIAPVPVVPPRPRPPRPRSFLTPIALCTLAIFGGLAIALPRHAWNSPVVAFAIALSLVGAVLLLSAWIGRARGLILVGLLLVPPFLVTQTVGGRWNDWRGTVVERPRSASAVQDSYEWGIGERTLDLRGVDMKESDHLAVSVDQSIGSLRLLLPPDTVARVQSHVGAGEITYPAVGPPVPKARNQSDPFEESGLAADSTAHITTGTGASSIDVDLHLGIGQISVTANDVTEVTR